MARAATTADAFNAVAEPRRREILDLLAAGERPVNDLVTQLGLAQPLVSNMRVLRVVGLVAGVDDGHSDSTASTRSRSRLSTTGGTLRHAWSQRLDLLELVVQTQGKGRRRAWR